MIAFHSSGWSGWASRWPLDAQAPTAVLIHCAGFDARLWLPTLEAGDWPSQWLAVNLPGHADSKLPVCGSVAEMAKALDGFIKDLELRRVMLIGHSLGGAVTLQLLIEAPVWLAAGGLVGTGARLRVLPQILDAVRLNYAAYLAHFVQVATGPTVDKQALKREVQAAAVEDSEVALADFKACDSYDVMARLQEIQLPVIVIHGSADQVTPIKYGEYLAQQIGSSRMVRLEGGGHLLPLEQPVKVQEILAGFLNENC